MLNLSELLAVAHESHFKRLRRHIEDGHERYLQHFGAGAKRPARTVDPQSALEYTAPAATSLNYRSGRRTE
jgi:hypothetical protein